MSIDADGFTGQERRLRQEPHRGQRVVRAVAGEQHAGRRPGIATHDRDGAVRSVEDASGNTAEQKPFDRAQALRPYDDQVHVPLMVWAPGVAPARVATPVGTIDIAPTVLTYLGQPSIPGAEGVDLLADGSGQENAVHCEVTEQLVLGETSLCSLRPRELPGEQVTLNPATAQLRSLGARAGGSLWLRIAPEAIHIMPVRGNQPT